jgi:hypothetical protein
VPSIAPAAAPSAPVAAAATPTVISLDQARGIAERAGNGQADKVAVDSGPAGITYDVSVIRSDGTDVELMIDGHTGRILSNLAEPQSLQDSNAPTRGTAPTSKTTSRLRPSRPAATPTARGPAGPPQFVEVAFCMALSAMHSWPHGGHMCPVMTLGFGVRRDDSETLR